MRARHAARLMGLLGLFAWQPQSAHAASGACAPADLARLSAWSGVWIAENAESGINGRELPGAPPQTVIYRLGGFDAPWNDEGWTRFEAMLRVGADSRQKVVTWGFPMMMDSAAPFKFVIAPAETVIVSQYRDIRYVYTDGRGHPIDRDRWPTLWGDSVGCWKGDTLFIETTDAKYSAASNYFAPPLSEKARYVERIRLASPSRLESEITITDPVTLERPWNVRMSYVRAKGLDRLIHDGDMFQDDRIVTQGDSVTIGPPRHQASPSAPPAPAEVRLTEGQLDRIAGDYAVDNAPLTLKAERRGGRLFIAAPPAQTFYLPLHAQDPLNFHFAGMRIRFITDAAGAVIGFSGQTPDGAPMAGKRLAPGH